MSAKKKNRRVERGADFQQRPTPLPGPSALILGLIEARTGTIGMWPFLLCFGPQIATISLIGPNSMAMALQRCPHMAGTGPSLMGVMQFGLGAVVGAVVGQTFDGTIAQ